MFDPSITCAYLYIITRYGYPPPAEKTPQYLREMKDLGFQSVELEGIRAEHLTQMHAMRHDVAAEVKRLELDVPYFCVVLAGLSSPDGATRDENLALFEKGCETAAALGGKGVLDNGPLPPYVFPDDVPVVRHFDQDVVAAAKFPDDLSWQTYWGDLVTTFQQACDIAKSHGLTYLLHPCLGVLTQSTDGYLHFRDAVGRDNLRFSFDTANLFVMKENLNLSLLRLGEALDYIHVSDNGGTRMEHLAMGDGVIRFDTVFESLDRINFRGHIGIDIGGSESAVDDLNQAYIDAAKRITELRSGG